MANDIRNATRGVAGARTIGIGHSMGGVALREIQARTAPGHVGGIITVGSSLNGAQIANTVGNGQLRAFISDGVNELTKGPARQLFAASYIIARAQTRTFTGRQLQEVLLNEIGLDNLVLAAATNNTVVDFTTTGNYMNQARQYNVTIPRVSIYGTEASPVHYRMASSFIGFRDTFFPDIFRAARGVYNAYYIKNLVSSINILNISRAAGWKAGRDYIDSKSEKGWNNLIGATRTESRRSCSETLVCDPDFYYSNCYGGTGNPNAPGCQNCWQTECRTYTEYYNEPSDGLLNRSTQMGQRTNSLASNWNPNVTYQIVGANHSEFNEHPNSRTRFNRVFDGLDNAPVFFKTDRR